MELVVRSEVGVCGGNRLGDPGSEAGVLGSSGPSPLETVGEVSG